MTFSTLHISDVYAVYIFKVSFTVISCFMKQFVK